VKSGARNIPRNFAALIMLLLAIITIAVWHQAAQTFNRQLEVFFLDVGQGDSIIISSPTGRTVLIDGGSHSQGGAELARQVILPALYRRGITRLDGLILTHPHDDHVGALAEVIEQVPVGMILEGEQASSLPAYRQFRQIAKARDIPVTQAHPGQIFNLGQGITGEVLHPQAFFLAGTNDDENNNSVVLRLTYGKASFIFCGDLQQEGEESLLLAQPVVTSAVLKVGHHGSLDATSAAFLEAVKPKWAIISVGAGNSFGHPHQDTLQRLAAAQTKVLRTDQDGMITARTDGQVLKLIWGRGKSFRQEENL